MKGYRKSTTPEQYRNQMQTPEPIIDWVARVYGCDVDLAARAENRKFPFYYSDVIDPLDADCLGNSLTEEWNTPLRPERRCGYCNPPYDNLTPWVQKAVNEAANGFTSVFLLPSLNGERWNRYCMFAREIIFIEQRINFIQPWDGLPNKGNNRGSMLVVFGRHNQTSPAISYIRQVDLK